MKNKKKSLITALICAAVLVAAAACLWFFWLKDYVAASTADPVYVTSVSTITGFDTGANPKYSGIVEPQQTYKIEKDESKTVSEVLVSPGNEIHIGDVLFRYDTEEMQLSLDQAQLDLEGITNQISTLQTQKTTLESEKRKADSDEQYSYTVQIQSVELQIKQQEYSSSVKKSEIDKLKKSLENADVISEVEGVVKEVNTTPKTDSSGQALPFISVLSSGEFRIKGTISELNLRSISEGQAVIVHSRIDAAATWRGTVESIDYEPTEDQNSNSYYYGPSDSNAKSSKYNFYVVLESLDGLILGQHVYIEPDTGESSVKQGLWLPAVYVAHDKVKSGSFVWVKNDSDKLEKRTVTLGEYDSDNDSYQINSGLESHDMIAYPADNLMEGMPTTTDASAMLSTGDGGIDGGMTVDPGYDGGVVPNYGEGDGADQPADDQVPSFSDENDGLDDSFGIVAEEPAMEGFAR